MKTSILTTAACLAWTILLTSCAPSDNQKCFIHYTADTLDLKSAKFRQVLASGAVLPKTQEALDSTFNACAALPYEAYAGTTPAFSSDLNVETIIDENGWTTMKLSRKGVTADFNMMYIHGGAFFMSMTPFHAQLCEAMVRRFNTVVYMPLYPLAPAHRVIEGTEMVLDAYKRLLEEGKPIYVMGDSAGGNLTLCLSLRLKELGMKLPDALFPISPVVDFTFENPEMLEIEKRDPMMNMDWATVGRHWAEDGMVLSDPRISPIYGDLKGMPRTLIFVGSDDIFSADEMLMYDKMREAGVEVGVLYGKQLWHTAPTFQIPVRDEFLDEVADFMK